jgi:hypothetical protein
MQMPSALIPLPASTAPAKMDLLEMDKIAQVIIACGIILHAVVHACVIIIKWPGPA